MHIEYLSLPQDFWSFVQKPKKSRT